MNTINELETRVYLTDKDETIETPKEMKCELYPHQKTIIKRILTIESKRFIKVMNGDFNKFSALDGVIETSACVLSEPFGSGKSLEVLGVIVVCPVPRPFPEHTNLFTRLTALNYQWQRDNDRKSKLGFATEVTKKYSRFLKPNIIISGSAVLIQWERAIKEFTNLKVMKIGNVHALEKFYAKFKNNTINVYDIILIKNGNITGNFSLDNEEGNKQTTVRSMINVFGKISQGCVWSRIIYDDFDTINIPADSVAINGLFSIFISATEKLAQTPKSKVITYNTVAEMLRHKSANLLSNVLNDRILTTNFNICNNPQYTETSLSIPHINMFKYVYANPDDNYMRLLGVMGEDDANNLVEMLNGDAIETAAETLGIKSTSVADIFEKMLGNKYERYIEDGLILDAINNAKMHARNINDDKEENQHPKGRYSATELEHIKTKLMKKSNAEFIKYNPTNLMPFLEEMFAEVTNSKEKNGIAINRVKDNIKEGSCQVCCLPLEEMDVIINKCCGIILCDECGIKGSHIGKHYDYKLKADVVSGKCPNCMAIIDVRNDIIFINKEFDIDSLLNAKGDEKNPEPELKIVEVAEIAEELIDPLTKKLMDTKNPKIKALISIIMGRTADEKKSFTVNIQHLLNGNCDKIAPANQNKKVLVFANYNETLANIENSLKDFEIKYLRLAGTYLQMSEIVDKFKADSQYNVLLINSSNHCAGLNIQFATDLIFFHKIIDQNIESQVAGRAQRIGRLYNLNIHYLLYKNEKI